jgi:allantoate deiminase
VQPSSTAGAAVASRATDGSRPPLLPSDGEQLVELERDLAAFLLTAADGGVDTQGAFAERSPLLRRAALLLSRHVPTGTDCVVGTAPGASALAQALAVETRLACLPPAARPAPGQHVVLVAATADDPERLAGAVAAVHAAGARCTAVVAVAGGPLPSPGGAVLLPNLLRRTRPAPPHPSLIRSTSRAAQGVGRASADRIAALIAEFAALSEPEPEPEPGTGAEHGGGGEGEALDRGVTRLGYSPMERRAHEVFAEHMRGLSLKVTTDAAGNTIAELPGRFDGPAVGTGSHLDSVPRAGRFDGIAGVVAAIEAARLLVEYDVTPRGPLRFVAFAAEEGARFGTPCLGSKFAAGLMSEAALDVTDGEGVNLADAMTAVGLDPRAALAGSWRPQEWAAFVELHIEQGGVLEAADTTIGAVDVVSGSTRLALTLHGRASHSGGTPMALRADALTAAAEIVLFAEGFAKLPEHAGMRTTVGRLHVMPGSITTIPGRVTLTLDVRDTDSRRQREAADTILDEAAARCRRRGVRLAVSMIGDTSPVVLPVWLRQLVALSAEQEGLSARTLTSGAGHDAQIVNRVAPAALLFVPSRDGLSHVPQEWTSSEDIARGTETLLTTLLAADAHLTAERGSQR